VSGVRFPPAPHKKPPLKGAFLFRVMEFYVYILQSVKNGRFYIGQTQDLNTRFKEHNEGKSSYTAKHTPWNAVWYCTLSSRSEAFRLEQKLKSFKSRARLNKYMSENPCIGGSENFQISDLINFRESTQE
jgi:putative endonuclease